MTKTLEELSVMAEKEKAVQACKNLMAYYLDLAVCWHNKEYMGFWADREDASLEMPWGRYTGKAGVVTCYLGDHGDVSDEDFMDYAPGIACVHNWGTEVIEVADDCKTARGIFLSTGVETYGKKHPEEIRVQGWCWGKYAVDFINDNGQWKIWHMHLFPAIMGHYTLCWTDIPYYEGFASPTQTDGETKIWQYNREHVYPKGLPEYPRPYKTFADVAPGYGYIE